jgi:enoyl-CoA hydratase/carnithine racemase
MSFWRLPRLIGMGWARHLILSGERIGATEAERIGLVHRVVARPELENELHAWAKRYAEVPPASLAWAKRLCNAAFDVPFDPAFEALGEGMAALLDTDDDFAARRAWLERRRRSPS